MASSHILQIFLRVTVQNQIRIAQWIVVDEVVQFRPLRHGHIQRILDPGAVNGNVKQKRQWTVCLPLDIPTGWEPRAKQQPTGLIAYGAARRRPVQVLFRTEKEKPVHIVYWFFLVHLAHSYPNFSLLSRLPRKRPFPCLPQTLLLVRT